MDLTFKEALALFVRAKEAEGMRARTIHDYRKHIEWLTRYLSEHHPDVKVIRQLTADVIRAYVAYLKNERKPYQGAGKRERQTKGLSVNTINIRSA
ncbi:phage integrase N-terminal SAM-like domain-containing protein [Laceyella sacchari]|jgi:integrase/recombinase XerD|uniref:Phage integrase N-terminal SAM-like domain-containing protein n=2 Tax=Laceyella sacchari TaxID=37482 RepID=A0ABY5U221_LACSH|nr:phage integrase N-terminal SAM-like domain-containing protein [Laceyella sacchari]UWE03704.1 phage integrase N-terminal SAM-like domain-containing protein [Laceyella sacchari]